jgi:hypothetical protein
MVRTELIKQQQKAYYQTIKGTEKLKESIRKSCRRYFNKKYATDPAFREAVLKKGKIYKYYKSAENGGVYKSIKMLFGDWLFYGR